jgi:carbon-monoxide dehydrogenase large subunit
MNGEAGHDDAHLLKFGIGQAARRKEDLPLIRGEGHYTDDVNVEGQTYAAMVRSMHAHGTIVSIDAEEARRMPGVLAVFTGADLAAAGYRANPLGVSVKNGDGTPMLWPEWHPLPADKVRHVGEPLAFVVAETAALARDAADAVSAEIDQLPVAATPEAAIAPGAAQIHANIPGNISVHFQNGDKDKVAAAFASAAHVTRLKIVNSRIVVNAMEPRSAVALYDPETETYTLHTGTQGVILTRNQMTHVMNIPPEKLRVLTGHVGGSFGLKAHPFPEDFCVLFAAKALGKPVKWTETRSGSFLADTHGRAHEMMGELALSADGHFLALRISGLANLGAYITQGGIIPSTINATKNSSGVYRTPLIEIDTKAVFTNTVPVGAYRGNGRPETNYYVERLVDLAADEMGIDPAEIRRLNHVQAEEIPYTAPSGVVYDSGNFPAMLEKALILSDWDGFASRRVESSSRKLLRGIGLGQFLEVTGIPNNEMGGIHFEADGTVALLTGTMEIGQGLHSTLAQVMVDKLGVPFGDLWLRQGDSARLIAGSGTGGSRSLMASGSALVQAADQVIEKGRKAAAHRLEAADADIEFHAGRFRVAGTDRDIGLVELAGWLKVQTNLPPGVPASLDVDHVFQGGISTCPNGCHVAEVEICPETGTTNVVRYVAVNDFGVIVNPMVVDGQLHGGVAQGIGQTLLERTVFDEDGQLITGSFTDYAMPRAEDIPDMTSASLPSPALTNPLGVKGCGEAGCAGSIASIMNAIVDALSAYGIRHIDMPATPERVWAAIRAANGEY